MKQISGKLLVKALLRNGWTLDRISGSHHILSRQDRDEVLSVPVHANRPIKPGLLRHLLKMARLSEHEI